jgi:hypothetical protein
MDEGSDKSHSAVRSMDLKVEGAEVTSLSAKGDMEIQAEERGSHDVRLNP